MSIRRYDSIGEAVGAAMKRNAERAISPAADLTPERAADELAAVSQEPGRGDEPAREWHGWQFGTRGRLHIGPLPGRKSVCIYTIQGSVLHVHAYARSEDEAHSLLAFLDGVLS